ncbi:MAG TPA: ATP-binding protein [Solirubrobacterales bacterium]
MTTSYRKPAPLQIRLDAVPGSVPRARTALAGYAREVGAPADDVELAVAEATSNAILHAFTSREPGNLDLRAEIAGGELQVTVADDGDGMRPHPQGGGLGLGLALIGQMTTSLTIKRPAGGGTEVRMMFPIAEGSSG